MSGFFFALLKGTVVELQSLLIVARRIHEISRLTNELQRSGVDHEAKADKTVVTKADYFVQAAITDHLRREHPNIPILAEESFAALEGSPALARDVDSMLREAGVGMIRRACLLRP